MEIPNPCPSGNALSKPTQIKSITHTKGNRYFEIVLDRADNTRRIIGYVDDNGCFICTSLSKDDTGYIAISYKGRNYRMHRLLYNLYFSYYSVDLQVRHLCHNKDCVNVFHYDIGTSQQNRDDDKESGKIRKKPVNLNAEDVSKLLRSKNKTNVKLAQEFEISLRTVYNIKARARLSAAGRRAPDKPSISLQVGKKTTTRRTVKKNN